MLNEVIVVDSGARGLANADAYLQSGVERANELGIVMCFTGARQFKH